MSSGFFKMPDKIFGISSSLIKLFFLPLGVVVLFLISLGLVIVPQFDSIKELQGSITKIRGGIKTTEEKRDYLTAVNQEKLVKDESYLSSAVLQEKNSYLLVGVIRNVADNFGYRVKSFSINPVKLKDEGGELLKVSDKDVATKLPVNLVLEGPEDKVIDLLKAMESSLPIMFVDRLGISSKLTVSELTLTVSSYYMADNQNLVSGNLSLSDLIPTKEENDLLDRISEFNRDDRLTQTLTEQGSEGKTFTEYSRSNPFTP